MGVLDSLLNFYDKKHKELLIIPILIIIFSLVVIGINYQKHGDFVQKGISLKGGTTVTIQKEGIDVDELSSYLQSSLKTADISVRELVSAGQSLGVTVDVADVPPEKITASLKQKYGNDLNYGVETTGESLGKSFFNEAIHAVLLAFIFMSIVVLIYFRAFVPAFYVVLAALTDILFSVALVDIFNIKIGTAGIAAFLMLIGYSVDTDILLTARVLRNKEGTVFERIVGSMRTGLTMTFSALAATLIAYFLTPSEVLKQIMLILFFGLLADIPATWFMNAGLLRMYVERKSKK